MFAGASASAVASVGVANKAARVGRIAKEAFMVEGKGVWPADGGSVCAGRCGGVSGGSCQPENMIKYSVTPLTTNKFGS